MGEVTLVKTRLREGVWQGVLSGVAGEPLLEVVHLGAPVPGVEVARRDVQGEWAVSVPIPLVALSDGVQTFVFRDGVTGATLNHFTLIAGTDMEDDIRAEMDLLRAELDLLKRAFRRHCLDTAG